MLTIIAILTNTKVVATNDSIVDQINITVPISCTMSGTGMNTHNANINNGTYTPNIGSTILHAFCNDNEGFAIYAAGYTGDEIGGTNSNKLVGTNASNNATIESGTATTAGNPDVSNWAMKLSTVSSPTPTYPITIDNGFSSYSQVPNTYTKVAHRDSGTDVGTNAEGTTLTTTYAAYISKTQPADTYSGQVIYTLVHPVTETPLQPQIATSGCINYFPNGSNVVGTMGCQSISASATSATLLASNFSRSGYGFAGWSNKYDYSTNPNQAGIKFYGPQEDITFTAGQYTGTNNGLSLYAVWVPSAGSLQDSSKVSELCGAGANALTTAPTNGTANLSSVSALTDQRDNETYAIAKLADGKCWMIENLRLEAENTRTAEKQALAQGYGTSATYGNFSGLADAESTGFTETYSANSLYSNDGSNDTINIGTSNYPAFRMPRYNNLNTPADASNRPQNPTSNTFTNNNTTVGMYSYGNYYTWSAAIADTAYYSSGDHGTTSLCPTGWRLPIGNQSTATNSFGALSVALGGPADGAKANNSSSPTGTAISKIFRSYPNNFLYSGFFESSSAHNRGSYGNYWSSTVKSNDSSYYLYLISSIVEPGTYSYYKSFGCSIRCIVPAGA